MIHRCPTSGLRVSGLWVSTPQANAKLADVSTWEYQDRTANISTRKVRERLRIVEVSSQSVYDVFTPAAVSTNSPCRHTLHWTSSTASQAEDTIRETYWIISAITQTGSEGVSTLVPPNVDQNRKLFEGEIWARSSWPRSGCVFFILPVALSGVHETTWSVCVPGVREQLLNVVRFSCHHGNTSSRCSVVRSSKPRVLWETCEVTPEFTRGPASCWHRHHTIALLLNHRILFLHVLVSCLQPFYIIVCLS